MKRKNITGIKIEQLVERGVLQSDLQWIHSHSKFPPTYFITVIEGENNSIIACVDGFGGCVSWAKVKGHINIIGKDVPVMDNGEQEFLEQRHPILFEAIKNIDL